MYFTFLAKIKRLQNVNHAPRPRDGSDGGREAVCPHFGRVCSPNHKNRTNAGRIAATAGGRVRDRLEGLRRFCPVWRPLYMSLRRLSPFNAVSRLFDVSPYSNIGQHTKRRQQPLKCRIKQITISTPATRHNPATTYTPAHTPAKNTN